MISSWSWCWEGLAGLGLRPGGAGWRVEELAEQFGDLLGVPVHEDIKRDIEARVGNELRSVRVRAISITGRVVHLFPLEGGQLRVLWALDRQAQPGAPVVILGVGLDEGPHHLLQHVSERLDEHRSDMRI